MNKLKDYIKIYNVLDKTLCKKIRKEIDKIKWQPHLFYSEKLKGYKPKNAQTELDVSWDNIETRKLLTDKVWQCVHKYIMIDFKNDYFKEWSGFTPIRFNRYHEGKLMAKHCDHIHNIFDGKRKGIPTLSCLGALNDNYEGGELILFDNKQIELKAGDLLIFPSNFMYPHEVKPVTKGTRYSYISWVY